MPHITLLFAPKWIAHSVNLERSHQIGGVR